MSWESTEEWPDGRADGGAFRGAAEIIVARREAPTLRDRARTWWHSTPDHPYAAMPMRVVLTPRWIYVETRRGERRRAPVEQILGSRREGGRVIYAVAEGEDLVIADRGGDALERALDEKIGVAGEWRSESAFVVVFISALIGLTIAIAATFHYRDEGFDRIHRGLTTAEAALGLYAGLGGILLMLLFITFFPQRWVADRVGLTSVRGLFGWVRSTIPVERVARIAIVDIKSHGKHGAFVHHRVNAVLRDPTDHRTLYASAGAQPSRAAEGLARAQQIGRRVARLYDVELDDGSD